MDNTQVELTELREDVLTLARLVVKASGMTPAMARILARADAGGREARPAAAPEHREAVGA